MCHVDLATLLLFLLCVIGWEWKFSSTRWMTSANLKFHFCGLVPGFNTRPKLCVIAVLLLFTPQSSWLKGSSSCKSALYPSAGKAFLQVQVILTTKKSYLVSILFYFILLSFCYCCYKVLRFLGGFWRLLLKKKNKPNLQKQVNELWASSSVIYNLFFKYLMRAITRHAAVFETGILHLQHYLEKNNDGYW